MPKRDVITHDSILLLAVIVEPALALALDPHAFALDAILVEVDALTVLLALVPSALVLAPVLPDKLALPMPLILLELTKILLAIGPDQVSIAVHFVVKPGARVGLLIRPDIDTLTLNLVHFEVSLVHRPIGERQLPVAVLLPLEVLPLVHRIVRPRL